MQDLTPVGLTKDGKQLVLISSAGEEFAVPVDTRLRAALRGENLRLGQLEMKMESALRPRDIQARIRAGESPEDVAAAAQTTVEAIMGFATPVLAERAHVAQNARRASVRRRSGESSSAGHTLGEAAELYFGDHTLHDEDVEWDAWRRADGRWALVASYTIGGQARTAEFSHDLPGRYVVAENDEARILTGELREPGAPGSTGKSGGRSTQGRRLSAVPSQDELPLGDDAIELVREPAADKPADLQEVGQTAAQEKAQTGVDPAADTADADWIAQERHTEKQRASGPGPEQDSEQDTEQDSEQGTDQGAEVPDDTVDAGPGASVGTDDAPRQPASPKKKSRSSVPSWDEIMFGGKNE